MTTTRKIISVEVTPEAKAAIDAVSESTGVDMKRIASRMYEWFAAQDDVMQKGILGLLPKGMGPDIVKLALERMSTDDQAATLESGTEPVHKFVPPSSEELASRGGRSGAPRKMAAHEPRKSPGSKSRD